MQMRKFDKGEKKAIKYGYKINDRAGGGRYTIQYFFQWGASVQHSPPLAVSISGPILCVHCSVVVISIRSKQFRSLQGIMGVEGVVTVACGS